MTSSVPRSPCTGVAQTITSSMRDYWDNRWHERSLRKLFHLADLP
jgi:hypothetical protein